MGKSGLCQVSGEFCEVLDEHHIIPREFGGSDGPTILLSPTVHQTLHRVYRNNSKLESFAQKYSPAGQRVIYQLASVLRQCQDKFDKVDNNRVTIQFTPDEYQKLQSNSDALGISVAELVHKLILKILGN